MSFIKMSTAAEHNDRCSSKVADKQFSRVPTDTHRWNASQSHVWDSRVCIQFIKHLGESATEYQSEVWT